MMRVSRDFQPTGFTIAGAMAMSIGALIYLADEVPRARNWHMFLIPALLLMAFGAVLALIGSFWKR
jgi:uncharacterized membrane protein SpoIIM required for sporulation